MGPGDPFSKRQRPVADREAVIEREPVIHDAPEDPTPPVPTDDDAPPRLDRSYHVESTSVMGIAATLAGLLLGLVFGLVLLLGGGWGAVLVLFTGLVGAALGAGVYAIATGRIDVAGAWRALLRR